MPTTTSTTKQPKKVRPLTRSSGDKIYREVYRRVFPIPLSDPGDAGEMFVDGLLCGAAAALEAVGFDYSRPVPVP